MQTPWEDSQYRELWCQYNTENGIRSSLVNWEMEKKKKTLNQILNVKAHVRILK